MTNHKPSGEGFRFPYRERLKGKNAIRAVFNGRQSVFCAGSKLGLKPSPKPGLKLFKLKNGLSYNRIAFTFPRKFGTAVERNRAKRISREAYRHLRQNIQQGWDMVLIIYSNEKSVGFSSRLVEFEELMRRARLLNTSLA